MDRGEHTLLFRLALDETLGIGADTDTPVSEGDAAQMPCKCTGTLPKVVVTIGEDTLSDADRHAIDEAKAHLGLRW